jgi:hypothetical protein
MKLPESNSTIAMIIVAVVTIIAQFPAVDKWIGQVTAENTHLVTIVEGIVGILLLIFAARKTTPSV